MSSYPHLLSFDLSSYGAAMALVNRFVDGETVRDFEVSPCGSAAQVVLLLTDAMALQLIQNEAQSLFASQILNSSRIENFHADLLSTYLSQNKAILKKSALILEFSDLSPALIEANNLLQKGFSLADFRVVRTFPKNVILTVTHDETKKLDEYAALSSKKTMISEVQPSLKSFFEIN